MQLALVHPEIPNNTGCIGRLAAGLGLPLHLVRPIGFSLEDKYLKRAGLDYWDKVDLHVHENWGDFAEAIAEGDRALIDRLYFFSARGGTSLFDIDFPKDAILIFGGESQGLPKELVDAFPNNRVRIPIKNEIRSLNIADAVCLAAYTALVSAGVALPE